MSRAARARAALASLRTPEGWLTASSPDGPFCSLFGRDALVSALQLLPVDPSIAHATLERLGRELGARHDPATEEEPGKVLHEARDADLGAYLAHGWPVRDGRLRYWGSVDAGLWFLILAAALARAGEPVAAHRRAVARVAAWLRAQPMPLAYARRASRGGLAHHWWRDVAADREGHGHGVVDATGRPLATPAALAAVQALAWRALVEVAATFDPAAADAADAARAAFARAFCDGRDVPLFALSPAGPDASATSDLGHVLWAGILEPRQAAATAARLVEPDLCTPWGLRTLSAAHPAFRPDGYHTGAVWPWDSWVGAGGLDAAGGPGSGDGVRRGVLAAVDALGDFPELYAVGTDGSLRPSREAARVQAWTVGAVLAMEAGWDGRAWAA